MAAAEPTVAELATACREQTKETTDAHDPCYELFRRGFEEQNEAAWTALHAQYHGLICRWIQRAGKGQFDHAAVSDLADQAFAKFWRTLQNSDVQITDRFASTSQLMGYLNRCAVSTLHDLQRKRLRHNERNVKLEAVRSTPQNVQAYSWADNIDNRELLAKLRGWIAEEVTDSAELRILHLTFVEELTPREIVGQYPREFPDTRAVRRVKERVLKRMRRFLANVSSTDDLSR